MNKKKELSVSRQYRKRSKGAEIWRNFRKNKGAMAGLAVLLVLFIIALTVDLWLDQEKVIGQNIPMRMQHPNLTYLFGTDDKGRDMFWRVIYGTKYSLAIGFVSVLVATVIGVPLGALAGYYGGKVEMVIMRIVDIFIAIPNILMAVVVVSILGNGVGNLMLAVGISAVPSFVRITRSAVLTVRNNEYIEAVKALGKRDPYIIFLHVLPNCLSPIIVQITLRVANSVIAASSLSFLGLGVTPPNPEWGALLNAGKNFIRGNSYLSFFPGLAIMITVLAFNLVGDGIRDAMDPKLKH